MKTTKAWTAIIAGLLTAAPAVAQEVLTDEEAAGVLGELPEMVIPLDDLVSKEDLLERVAKHVEEVAGRARDAGKAAGVPVQIAAPVIPPGLESALEAIEAGDDDRLREVLSHIAGVEVALPTAEQRHQHDESAVYMQPERYATDEILARMGPERVAALADHRHLLDDEWELIDALRNMDNQTRSAAREFLAKMRDPEPVESILPPELKEQIRQAQERGWYEADSPSRGAGLLREASKLGLPQSSLSDYDEHIPGTAASYSFRELLPPGGRIEVVEDTVFGGVLYAAKSEAADVRPDDPNLHILGHDASVSTARHADGVWATTLTAFDGSHMYEITVEERLEGEERAEFVRMATTMIEGDLSRGSAP